MSKKFKVQEIKVKEIVPSSIEIWYPSEPKEDGESKIIKTTLYKRDGASGVRKVMVFRRTTDFEFTALYTLTEKDENDNFGPTNITTIKLTGVENSLKAEGEGMEILESKLKVTMELDDSSLFKIISAAMHNQVVNNTAVAEHQEAMKGYEVTMKEHEVAMKKYDASMKEYEAAMKEYEAAVKAAKAEQAAENNSTETKSADAKEAKEAKEAEEVKSAKQPSKPSKPPAPQKPVKPLPQTTVTPIGIAVVTVGIERVPEEVADKILERMEELNKADKKRKDREEARNNLEELVYKIKDGLANPKYVDCGKEKEVNELTDLHNEVSEWIFEDEGINGTIEEFRARIEYLQ